MNTLKTKETLERIHSVYIPLEITQDIATGITIASFDYYTGIKYCDLLGIKQCDDMNLVGDGTHFIVCCGYVMVRVKTSAYPQIIRRIL